jgi:putative SbcD/Mre11-related phosphoesterase
MDQIKFVTGKPALLVGKSLVVADLHLGIEREFYQSGIKFPSQTEKIKDMVEGLVKITKAERLILLGDVKHKVPGISLQELREIPQFLEHFSGKLEVDMVPGNHDAGIEKFLPPGVKTHPSAGFRLGDVYLNHGHTWPGPDFLGCKKIVIGHQHPLVEFRDKLGYRFREPVWVKGALNREKLEGRYKKMPASLPSITIMPAFNPLIGGMCVNKRSEDGYAKKFIGPLINSLKGRTASTYLLDGTCLGRLVDLKRAKL